jgi:vacuolar protein sorting-associated protein 13D
MCLIGQVELENLPLKKDALKSLGLPIEVKSGELSRITSSIASVEVKFG